MTTTGVTDYTNQTSKHFGWIKCLSPKAQKSIHVAYQIKADDAGSNMVANILPTDTPSTKGVE